MLKTTKKEFEEKIKSILTEKGFTKISVSVSLFGGTAEIYTRDPHGEKRCLRAEKVQRRGKEYIQFYDEEEEDDDFLEDMMLMDMLWDDDD